MKKIVFYCLLVILLLGCQEVTSPPPSGQPEIDFTTDSSSYSLTKDKNIRLSIENNSGIQYYIAVPSNDFTLERKSNDDWINLGSWYYTIQIVPDYTPLESTSWNASISEITGVISLKEGQYRFEYILYLDEKATKENQKVIHTNSFTVQP